MLLNRSEITISIDTLDFNFNFIYQELLQDRVDITSSREEKGDHATIQIYKGSSNLATSLGAFPEMINACQTQSSVGGQPDVVGL